MVHLKSFSHPNTILSKAKEEMSSYAGIQGQQLNSLRMLLANYTLGKWHKSPLGFVKVNWDAGCNRQSGKLELGVIIRDHSGLMMGTLRASIIYNNDPFTTKVVALLEVASFCKDVGFSNNILEGDALQVAGLLGKDTID